MTRVYNKPRSRGGTRLLVLGASAYPHAQVAKRKAPKLEEISSAAKSAIDFAYRAIEQWETRFPKPLASVDLLVDTPAAPDGTEFTAPDGVVHKLDSPTMAKVKEARKMWMADIQSADVLIFYCCGHGIWLPAAGRTFLTASFGADEDNPWLDAIALDDFRLALGEYAPRQQWLIYDCCSNTPTQALKAMKANADPLLTSVEGQRRLSEETNGLLSQVVVASASPGALSFGKEGRASRFMEAFLEACEGAGCRRMTNGKWWVDQQGIEEAIATYRLRVAPIEEEEYFTFPRVTQTDAAEVPRLLGLDGTAASKPKCTLLVRSVPPHRLKSAELTIFGANENEPIGKQQAGSAALARYRIAVAAWLDYKVNAAFDEGPITLDAFAIPPLTETLFEVP